MPRPRCGVETTGRQARPSGRASYGDDSDITMNWHDQVRAEFARRLKTADDGVVEELAQHAAAAYEAARADGAAVPDAESSVRALIASWCAETTGPRRLARAPLLESVPVRRSWFAGVGLDIRL